MAIEIRRFAVEVFAQNMLVHGYVQSARRLTDMVNEPEAYLSVDESHIFPYLPDALLGLEEHGHGLINKASVVLLTELETQRASGAAPPTTEARVPKEPHRILIYADQFAINADIHLAPAAEMTHFLTQAAGRFIPVTNATVTPTQPGTQLTSFRRQFLLVNAEQIGYLGGLEAVEAAPPPEAGGDLIG